jgi:GTPase
VGLRGPGETQLETDRRVIGHRIVQLRRELEEVRRHRREYRAHRKHQGMVVVSLVGYTNAGKSTLLNALTGANVLATDRLFATLDPTTRRLRLPSGKEVLLTDTVGFIQKLPTQLVASFRATLEEISDSDLVVHVVDVTHPNVREQVHTVEETLQAIGAGERPLIAVLNKIDLLSDPTRAVAITSDTRRTVAISAIRGDGLQDLMARMEEVLAELMVPVRLLIPYRESDLATAVRRRGIVLTEEHTGEGAAISARIPTDMMGMVEPYLV